MAHLDRHKAAQNLKNNLFKPKKIINRKKQAYCMRQKCNDALIDHELIF